MKILSVRSNTKSKNLSSVIYLSGGPSIYESGYSNRIEDETTDALVTVYCLTSSSPPTTVVWSRDGVKVPVDGVKYETHQSVIDRRNSYYRNLLIVRDTIGITHRPTYICSVTNVAGSATTHLHLHSLPRVTVSLSGEPKKPVVLMLCVRQLRIKFTFTQHNEVGAVVTNRFGSVSVSLSAGASTIYGLPLNEDFSLVCEGEIPKSLALHKLRLEEHVHVQWSDKTGPILNMANSTISGVSLSGNNIFKSTLLFRPLSKIHDRLYSCSMSIEHPTRGIVLSDSSEYRVIFGMANRIMHESYT